MQVDLWILAFSAATVIVTIWMGFWSARRSRTVHDFFVAGRSVSVGWNASAISGEYLSAASFMGVAGMVMSSGYDALWYPVCYACGYLFLLLFIAGPLRRFGAYTIPDFAEGRFDSPLFRKIAVVFVLFIGFFYTMPQMKGAGTTLSYIFQDLDLRGTALAFLAPHTETGEALPGLNYAVGVFVVGAVITLNVALGGMKGITLVQAFQYWLKMFAISVPVFVLMAVYGHYGAQLGFNKARLPHRETIPNFSAEAGTPRALLPTNAPKDSIWLNPFGPLTTKAVKAATAQSSSRDADAKIPLRAGLAPNDHLTAPSEVTNVAQAISMYADLTGRQLLPRTNGVGERFDELLGGRLSRWKIVKATPTPDSGLRYHGDGVFTAEEMKASLDALFRTNGLAVLPAGEKHFRVERASSPTQTVGNAVLRERRYALLYTYSLIIALVCGTAGLPHILVRFYTNPDGVAAKRTTMWVMILIGVFYVFPPVFGVMGRNLMPELYNGLTGVKGTDGVVLKLPRLLGEQYGALGSILSGITCAGAFAAFMSTFSGLLVSITGALAHDIYGRMLRPRSTPDQRMRAFKLCSVICGGAAIALGFLVESFEINKLVGWAFAIAATSYFPLLFLSTWWRNITMKGAAWGMLTGGTLSLAAIASTMFADQAKWAGPLKSWYAAHPLERILAEQPAIWALPLAIALMFIISRLTRKEVPPDIRMKMLVLHAPEKLGLKQEYIQEHQPGH